MMVALPHFEPGQSLSSTSAQQLNELVARVRRADSLTVGPGLKISRNATGINISLAPQKKQRPQPKEEGSIEFVTVVGHIAENMIKVQYLEEVISEGAGDIPDIQYKAVRNDTVLTWPNTTWTRHFQNFRTSSVEIGSFIQSRSVVIPVIAIADQSYAVQLPRFFNASPTVGSNFTQCRI